MGTYLLVYHCTNLLSSQRHMIHYYTQFMGWLLYRPEPMNLAQISREAGLRVSQPVLSWD